MPRLKIIQNGKEDSVSFDGEVLLSDLLEACGYMIPHQCGRKGICKKCEVHLNDHSVLACKTILSEDGTVILPASEEITSVIGEVDSQRLTDHVALCLDIGTTTLALALISLDEKRMIRHIIAPNPQRAYGADVISRIDYCMKNGVSALQMPLLKQIQAMTDELLCEFGLDSVENIYVAGNTTMLHLFWGVDCSSMGVSPYTPSFLEQRKALAAELGLRGIRTIVSLPGISAFVGADIVAGMKYVGLPPSGKYNLLVDLGTNAEISLFSNEHILCTAAAAGPCFEGANISCGMSASPGAICAYAPDGAITVIGNQKAKGLCATGLIDAIAENVRSEKIDETGFLEEDPLYVCENVFLSGKDIREFQLAKSAIRAAIESLLIKKGITYDDISQLFVAGGFSSGLNVKNAAFVQLIPEELCDRFQGVNNACLLGIIKQVCYPDRCELALSNAEYTDLSADPHFAELFMEYMMF